MGHKCLCKERISLEKGGENFINAYIRLTHLTFCSANMSIATMKIIVLSKLLPEKIILAILVEYLTVYIYSSSKLVSRAQQILFIGLKSDFCQITE